MFQDFVAKTLFGTFWFPTLSAKPPLPPSPFWKTLASANSAWEVSVFFGVLQAIGFRGLNTITLRVSRDFVFCLSPPIGGGGEKVKK